MKPTYAMEMFNKLLNQIGGNASLVKCNYTGSGFEGTVKFKEQAYYIYIEPKREGNK